MYHILSTSCPRLVFKSLEKGLKFTCLVADGAIFWGGGGSEGQVSVFQTGVAPV